MKKRLLFLFYILLVGKITNAATIDTVVTYSAVMKKDIKAVVITPADYSSTKKFPVLYLLHGFSGNYSDWISKVPYLKNIADQDEMIMVCPDGAFASWYIDSPMNKDWMYDTYISKELIKYIDSHYSTRNTRLGRAITGLSMGGHGALYLAFKHLDIYGAAGSMSGAVDLRPFSDSFGIEMILGKYSEYPERWDKNSVINMIYLLKPNSLAITFDCGAGDFLIGPNKALDEKLTERNIPHDFTVRPGSHTWDYWSNAIKYQAIFFNTFFVANSDSKK